MKPLWLVLGFALLVTAIAGPAHAHDPFEITAVARLRSERLAVEVTMARSTARRLATGDRSVRATFAPEAFAAYQPKLEAVAPSLYAITSDEEPLVLRARSVRLTDEGDVEIIVASTSPPGARLGFRASHLEVLGEGYASALGVALEEAKPSQVKLLTRAEPLLEYERERAEKHDLGDYGPLFVLLGVLVAGRLVERLTRREPDAHESVKESGARTS